MRRFVSRLYQSRKLARVFHTLPEILRAELSDCETVLDLGCGPSSPIRYCTYLKQTVGVEPFLPYFERAVSNGTHDHVLNRTIEDVDFPEKSFDAVLLIEVVEHLDEQTALDVLHRAERWAKKKVVVTSPNGFVPQGVLDGNELQRHLSGWPLSKMKHLGFRSVGLAGLRWLRKDVHCDTMANDLFASIRLRPRLLWFAFASFTQLVTFHVPAWAFGLFSVKAMNPDIAGTGASLQKRSTDA